VPGRAKFARPRVQPSGGPRRGASNRALRHRQVQPGPHRFGRGSAAVLALLQGAQRLGASGRRGTAPPPRRASPPSASGPGRFRPARPVPGRGRRFAAGRGQQAQPGQPCPPSRRPARPCPGRKQGRTRLPVAPTGRPAASCVSARGHLQRYRPSGCFGQHGPRSRRPPRGQSSCSAGPPVPARSRKAIFLGSALQQFRPGAGRPRTSRRACSHWVAGPGGATTAGPPGLGPNRRPAPSATAPTIVSAPSVSSGGGTASLVDSAGTTATAPQPQQMLDRPAGPTTGPQPRFVRRRGFSALPSPSRFCGKRRPVSDSPRGRVPQPGGGRPGLAVSTGPAVGAERHPQDRPQVAATAATNAAPVPGVPDAGRVVGRWAVATRFRLLGLNTAWTTELPCRSDLPTCLPLVAFPDLRRAVFAGRHHARTRRGLKRGEQHHRRLCVRVVADLLAGGGVAQAGPVPVGCRWAKARAGRSGLYSRRCKRPPGRASSRRPAGPGRLPRRGARAVQAGGQHVVGRRR